MPARPFFDTNILIYAFAANDPKGTVAEDLLAKGGATSVQVFNEFTNVSRRKLGLDWDEVDARVGVLKALIGAPTAITEAAHDEARRLARRYQLAFYDALIIASARECGATALYSEDLQHGFKIADLTVRNPFA